MKLRSILTNGLTGAVLVTGLLSGGCVSSSKVSTTPGESTGQQLIDLQKAYKDGIITQEQYDKLKNEVVRKND